MTTKEYSQKTALSVTARRYFIAQLLPDQVRFPDIVAVGEFLARAG